MPTILLLRHAQSTWNAEGRWQGQADPPLSPRGEEQAVAAARRLARGLPGAGVLSAVATAAPAGAVDLVVTSDLRRARRTGELLAGHLGAAAPHLVEPALRELDVGSWSGLTRPEIEERWPGELDRFDRGVVTAAPGGESRDRFDSRVGAALGAVTRLVNDRRAGCTLVVSHGGVLRSVARLAGMEEVPVGHLGGLVAEAGGGRLTVSGRIDLLSPTKGEPAPLL